MRRTASEGSKVASQRWRDAPFSSLQSGDAGTLYDSVTTKLFTLPDATFVYPAHDYRGQTVSTIGEEKSWNPRFVGRNRAKIIQFMNNLNLPDPKKMMEAVPANEQCGRNLATAKSLSHELKTGGI